MSRNEDDLTRKSRIAEQSSIDATKAWDGFNRASGGQKRIAEEKLIEASKANQAAHKAYQAAKEAARKRGR